MPNRNIHPAHAVSLRPTGYVSTRSDEGSLAYGHQAEVTIRANVDMVSDLAIRLGQHCTELDDGPSEDHGEEDE